MAKFTDKQIQQIIDNIHIIIDTAEKNMPNHIAKTLDEYNIKWDRQSLNSGDYSAFIPPIPEINFEGLDFRDELVVERKNSLSEISQNLTKYKARFKREFERSPAKMIIMIEDTYENGAYGNYDSKINPKSLLGLLHSWQFKYDAPIVYIAKDVTSLYIYNTFKYYLRYKLKGLKTD